MAGPGDTVEIKITGDSSDLSAAMADVASRIDLLINALAGTAQKFDETGASATKSMKKVEDSTKKAATATAKLTKETDKQAKAVKIGRLHVDNSTAAYEQAADSAGRADSALSSFATVLDGVNPEMAKNARLAADMAGGVEQMILAFTQAPFIVGWVGGIIAAWEAATFAFRKSAEENIAHNEKIGESYDRLSARFLKMEKQERARRKELNILLGVETRLDQQRKEALDVLDVNLRQTEKVVKQNIKDRLVKAENWAIEQKIFADRRRRLGVVRERHKLSVQETNDLYDLKQANEDAAGAIKERVDAEKEANRVMGASIFLMPGTVKKYEVFVHQMTSAERAADDSAEAFRKMHGGLLLTDDAVKILSDDFAESRTEVGEFAVAGSDAAKRLEERIRRVNVVTKENTGSQEDFFKVIKSGAKVYGAINTATEERLDLLQVEDLMISLFLQKERERLDQLEKEQAAIKSWVDGRSRLLESLVEQSFAAEQALREPFDALEKAHKKEMADLDEIIAKYDRGAKTSTMSAQVIAEAEELKLLKTTQYLEGRQELLEETEEKELAGLRRVEAAMDKIRGVSKEKEVETHRERVQALMDYRIAQEEALEEAHADALAAGANEIEALKALNEEKLEIHAEWMDKRSELDKEFSEKQKARRLDDLREFGEVSSGFATGVADALEAIYTHSEQLSTDQKRKLFYLSQAAAMSDVAINGIVAISETLAAYGATPAGIALSIGLGATTAAQIATIAAEQPSFDIGGVIRGGVMADSPDQMGVSVLPGESILNRSATERLGEGGVNALNGGGGTGQEIIVVPAYRHFDRFIKDEYRKGGAFRRFFNDAREYPVGQRSY